MGFKKSVKRAERSNVIDNFVNGTIGEDMSIDMYESMFEGEPATLLSQVHEQDSSHLTTELL